MQCSRNHAGGGGDAGFAYRQFGVAPRPSSEPPQRLDRDFIIERIGNSNHLFPYPRPYLRPEWQSSVRSQAMIPRAQ